MTRHSWTDQCLRRASKTHRVSVWRANKNSSWTSSIATRPSAAGGSGCDRGARGWRRPAGPGARPGAGDGRRRRDRRARLRPLQRRRLRRRRRPDLSAPPRRPHGDSGSSAEELATGVVPRLPVGPGTATAIATGGMLPRGADAVVMVEHTTLATDRNEVLVHRPVAPGAGVTFAGTDMARGELVLRKGTRLSARETGVLAAIGRGTVNVVRRPRVAIVSTGDEIIAPGAPIAPATVYDANATLLADAVCELGGEPVPLGIVGDDPAALDAALDQGPGVRPRAAQRRDEQGSRRPLVPRTGKALSRHTRAWRGAEARQAHLPGRHRVDSRGDPAGIPDLGHLHVPRVCGSHHPPPGGNQERAWRDTDGPDARAVQ